jgi:hypothetical protein
MEPLLEVVRGRLIKRGVPVKNLKIGEPIPGAGSSVRRELTLTQGIPTETAKAIQKAIKEGGFKKVQASIQGDELRVTSPSKDELQAVMAFLRGKEFDVELSFGNYRGWPCGPAPRGRSCWRWLRARVCPRSPPNPSIQWQRLLPIRKSGSVWRSMRLEP